jgi:hypothetical protein
MTRKELQELRRSSMLALKTYYVQSIEADLVATGNPFQVEAAAALHEACCRELGADGGGRHLSTHAEAIIEFVVDEFEHQKERGRKLESTVADMLAELRDLLDVNCNVDDDQVEEEEEGA